MKTQLLKFNNFKVFQSNFYHNNVGVRFSKFKPINVDQIKAEFRNYGGGCINFEATENIGIIKLNYPQRRNAMSGKMMAEFHDTLLNLESNSTLKGLILTGQGDFFCAGGDLQTVAEYLTSSNKGWEMTCLMHESLKKFQTLPMISVSLVQGRALGGGAELPLATDIRIFTPAGKLSYVQAKMGVIPGTSSKNTIS